MRESSAGVVHCLGSTGWQPVVVGSLPTTPNARQELCEKNVRWAFRQAAEKDRLAACAPQKGQRPLAKQSQPNI